MSNGIALIEANVYMSRAVRLLDAADIDALSDEAGLTPIWSAKGRLVLKHLKVVIRELDEYRTKLAESADFERGVDAGGRCTTFNVQDHSPPNTGDGPS